MVENSILFIEWSENIENVLPDNTITVCFSRTDSENERIIEIDGGKHHESENIEKDKQLTVFLESKGYKVIRIRN